MTTRLTASELASRARISMEVVSTYPGVKLSSSSSPPPNKPSIKVALTVCIFIDVQQRTRLTFSHPKRADSVLQDAVIASVAVERHSHDELVALRFYDYTEVGTKTYVSSIWYQNWPE
jgi:hypothetical protein